MATKSELAREEARRKREFYAKLLGVVLDAIVKHTTHMQSKLDFKVRFTGRNRYIHFSVYGFKMNVLIYTKGQVVIQLEEMCHGEYEQQIYEYTDSVEEQEACLVRLKEIMDFMIPLFTGDGIVDPHTFMDYLKEDLEDAYRKVQKDWKRYEEDEE